MWKTGKILGNILEERGISQVWLADKIGVTKATISRWVSGVSQPPAVEILYDMSKLFDVSSDYLLGLSPDEHIKKDLSSEEKIIVNCFRRASSDDISVVWAILGKYMTKNEKLFSDHFVGTSEKTG